MKTTRSNPAGLALVGALLVSVAACDSPFGVQGGNVRIVLSAATDVAAANLESAPSTETGAEVATTDGPMLDGGHDGDHDGWRNPFFVSANVTFSSILARNLDGVLTNIDGLDLPTTLDVVTMEDGRQIELPEGDLPEGTYDQIVVVMTQVEGVTHDSTTVTITPPGGGWTAIVPICPFEVAEGETSVVGLALSVRRSFAWRDGRFHFQPHFVCDQATDDEETEG